MNEDKIIYDDYEITYANNDVEVKCLTTGKIYCSKFKTFKIIKQLQQENARLKDKIKKGLEELNKTDYEYSSRTEYANIIMNTKEILKEN